jgi:hypothetical protein
MATTTVHEQAYQFPPLPKLDGDARYMVLIHPTVANPAAADPDDTLGSRPRLDDLGKVVLDMILTWIPFDKKTPVLSHDSIRVRVQKDL